MMRGLLLLVLALLASVARAEVPIQAVTSPGGIKAWLVEEHSIPFTALEVRFKGGASLDPPGKRGAINLMTGLLEEGAGDLDAQGYATAVQDLAAGFGFSVGDDSLAISARFLTENRESATELLRTVILAPRFDPDALERVRSQVLAGIRDAAQDPGTLAARRFDALAFGPHPYGTARDGTEASVGALTRTDMLAAHRGALARDRLFVAAVGDITPEALGLLLDRLFGALPAVGAPQPSRATFALTGGVTVIPFETPQSSIVFGQPGIRRDDPDFFAAFVLNEVLAGGRFSARLMTELREKRGLTYGVSAYLAPMSHAEVHLGQFSTQNEKVAEAIAVVREEWQRAASGITEEELEASKTYLTGAYPLRFDGNGPIADILVGMQMEGLPIDYSATRNARLAAVTRADVARVAARLMRPDLLHFVVVGQPVGVQGADGPSGFKQLD